ncbi:MAG: ribosomal protein S18-alanine N-acetyltransferase [Dehalococcoidia bacterium]
MKTAARYLVRTMHLEDIPQVMEIERASFPTIWPPTAFRRELQQNRLANYIVVSEHNPHADDNSAAPGTGPIGRLLGEIKHLVQGDDPADLPPPSERPELIVGFVGVWLLPDEAHIVTIATRDSHRSRGIGEQLLIAAIELALDRGQPLMTLEVRVSNEPAINLYRKYGFEEVGRRHNYYSDNREDALILTINSIITRRYREAFEQLHSDHTRTHGDLMDS